jgi:hypothetical protein
MSFCRFNILVEKAKGIFQNEDVFGELTTFIQPLVSIEELVSTGEYTRDLVKYSDSVLFMTKQDNCYLAFEVCIPSPTPLGREYIESLLNGKFPPVLFRLITVNEPIIEHVKS